MTRDPKLGYVPVERLTEGEAVAARLRGNREHGVKALVWNERGPNNLSGRTRAILIDKNDATGNTVFAGSVGGGLWRTTNFRSATPTWTQILSVSANLAITTLAQDPGSPNIMYAGTGEGYFNVDAIRGLGIYKSTDGGLTWSLLASTTYNGANYYDFFHVQKILVYSNGDVYASGIGDYCNVGGIFKSTNGGGSWSRVIGSYGGGGCNFAFDFLGYDIEMSKGGDLYATVVDNSTADTTVGKVYRSPAGANVGNAGTWINITPPPPAAKYWQRIQLACSPLHDSTVYAIMQGTADAIGGIRRTDDAGATWNNIDNTTAWCDQGTATSTDFSRNQAWYNLTLTIKPDDDRTVFAGGVDVMATWNAGASWSQVTQWAAGCGSLPFVHADIHSITFFPGSNSEFIVSCDGGIFYTSDGGTTFSNKNQGYHTIQYYSVALHPTSGSDYMLAGAMDNGTHSFSSSGLNNVTTVTGGDGGFCFIDSDNPNYQISAVPWDNYNISTNGGATFSLGIGTGHNYGRFINPTDYDNMQNLIYAASANGYLLRMGDITAATIGGLYIQMPDSLGDVVSALKVDPNTANRVWVALSNQDGDYQTPELFYLDNANTNAPTATGVLLPAALTSTPGFYISSLDVEQGNASHILMTVSNYGASSVWESTDMGNTWTALDNNGYNLPDVPVRWGIFLPSGYSFTGRGSSVTTGGIMLATELGVWTTTSSNGTSTVWTQSSSMQNVRVDMLRLRASDGIVAAATHGRGVFTAVLPSSLPVNLITFDGRLNQQSAVLNWTTSNENYLKGYDIEKSEDGKHFTRIGTQDPYEQSDINKYMFRDPKLQYENYYRLRINDLDNKFTYSSTVLIRYIPDHQQITVLNNPFQQYIDLRLAKPATVLSLHLYNSAGIEIAAAQYQKTAVQIRWNLPAALKSGMYILRMRSDEEEFTQKLIRQ